MAAEIMIGNSAIKTLIREGKTYQIPNVIQTSAAEGMISLDKVLAEYVSRGDITLEDALAWSLDPKSFKLPKGKNLYFSSDGTKVITASEFVKQLKKRLDSFK